MSDRYFMSTPLAGGQARLAGAEAHHLIHVMRAKRGDRVVLFDGSGWEFTAEIQTIDRAEVGLRVLEGRHVDRELPIDFTLAVALPKGERQKWLVEKAVELGVTRLVPLVTTRSVVRGRGKSAERLRRVVVEASKQCGRNRLMTISDPQPWGQFVSHASDAAARLVADPGAEEGAEAVWRAVARQRAVVAAVGPEGGFTREEIRQAAEAGWKPVSLGRRILRVETAALCLAALVAGHAEPG